MKIGAESEWWRRDVAQDVVDATCPKCREEGRGTYVLPAVCGNCGTRVLVRMSRGHLAADSYPECPYCGCSTRWRWNARVWL